MLWRYPALRIRYLGDDRAAQVTYLAFDTPADRANPVEAKAKPKKKKST